MKILSWNSRGLENPQGIQALRDLVKKKVPKIMFIQETKLADKRMERLKFGLGMSVVWL